MKELFEQLKTLMNEMLADGEKALNGNSAAARRVRKATLDFEKVAKDFRKVSVEEEKAAKASKK